MSRLNKLRARLKFRLNWANFASRLLKCCRKVFRGETTPRTTSREYYGRYEDCQTSIEDDPRSGRHAAATWGRFHWESSAFHFFKSKVSSPETGRRMFSVSRRVSYHFKGKVKRALCRSKIGSASADWRPEGATQCLQSRTASSSKRRRILYK
jgi:hypothetical protein